MTNEAKLALAKNKLVCMEGSPKNIKCPGVLRKTRRIVRNLEKKIAEEQK